MSLVPLAPAGAPLAPAAVIEGCGLREQPLPEDRPRVIAAMIGSADGRAAMAGRSVGLGHPADRGMLRGLRAAVDAVVVGAATVRAERYANLLDREHVEARRAAGLSDRPLVAVLTRSGDVPRDAGIFAEPEWEVVVFSEPVGEVLAELRSRGAELVLCEGGPRLLREVVAAGVLDELFLTVAPLLAAGDAPTTLTGPELDPPAPLELVDVLRADDHAFLHYRSR